MSDEMQDCTIHAGDYVVYLDHTDKRGLSVTEWHSCVIDSVGSFLLLYDGTWIPRYRVVETFGSTDSYDTTKRVGPGISRVKTELEQRRDYKQKYLEELQDAYKSPYLSNKPGAMLIIGSVMRDIESLKQLILECDARIKDLTYKK